MSPPRFLPSFLSALSAIVVLVIGLRQPVDGTSWRIGDADHPWRLHPVSALLNVGEPYRPDYIWGGAYSVEVAVDDDGDGLVNEDPVDLVDDDGDGQYNEDPANLVDDDHDGLVDEDGPDVQWDNDGDGLLNEDGLRTGGVIYDPALRAEYENEPFFRHPDAASAAADTESRGYGWGDDDRDGRSNEDPVDGEDNDRDGLVDEDPAAAPVPLPRTILSPTFTYDTGDLTVEERRSLAFRWDGDRSLYSATTAAGVVVTASARRMRLTPRDLLRPIRMDSTRNMVTLTGDRFLSGVFGSIDPMNGSYWGAIASHASGVPHAGTSGYAQVADGNIFSARSTSQASYSRGFNVHFLTLYHLHLIRLRPRPDFPDRTPTTFDIFYAGDLERHYQKSLSKNEEVNRRMVVRDPVIPRQTDQLRPVVKEYRFEEGGEFGPPPRVRILNFWSAMPEGQTWELAEFEAYGSGYALDASYATEIIDVGTDPPRFRRYFDDSDPLIPDRPVTFESFHTTDADDDGHIGPEERAEGKASVQFDTDLMGRPVTWGRVRWHGQTEGEGGDVHVRVRSGTSLDTRVYTRKIGRGTVSPFIDRSLVADWPAPGDRIDPFTFAELTPLQRTSVKELAANAVGREDGLVGGWTSWSAPFAFEEGLVDRDGGGGMLLPLPPLHRYIQFRFDFVADAGGGVSLDYLEFDFSEPVVTRSIVAEIFPDTASHLGVATSFQYVLKPDMAAADAGFNRIEILVPSREAVLDSLLVDDLAWERLLPPAEALADSRGWLDTLTVTQAGRFASATYLDATDGAYKLGIKTAPLTAADFPRGNDAEMTIVLTSPVFRLLTRFHSWIWNDAVDLGLQPTQPGNASDRLPTDEVMVTVESTRTLQLRNVNPNPFTPNGDGINDAAVFGFDVFLLTSDTDISVSIFGLDGGQVRKLMLTGGAGNHQLRWDGRDGASRLVPPGIYLYRLYVNSDTEKPKERTGTITVAY